MVCKDKYLPPQYLEIPLNINFNFHICVSNKYTFAQVPIWIVLDYPFKKEEETEQNRDR